MKVKTSQAILIIEDSPEDYEATLRAFTRSHLGNPIFHCDNGDDALDFLYHRGSFQDMKKYPRPGIILLDLNIPGTDGREALEIIKSSPELKTIPVIVLTTSDDRQDIEKCYRDGANSYIQKPVNLNKFIEAIERLKEYWFEITILPEEIK
jgi:two-component system, response regulator